MVQCKLLSHNSSFLHTSITTEQVTKMLTVHTNNHHIKDRIEDEVLVLRLFLIVGKQSLSIRVLYANLNIYFELANRECILRKYCSSKFHV